LTNAQTRLEKYIFYTFFSTDIDAPQRKREIEPYGEREKLYLCCYFHMNEFCGPPAPPPSLSVSPTSTPQRSKVNGNCLPHITVSLSFSVVSHGDTNAGQSDPKQMRKEDPSGGTFFQTEHKSKDLKLATRWLISKSGLVCVK